MNTNFDESLYSRQIYTIGRDAMGKITQTNVHISCCGNFSGIALELAKCIILAGVKYVKIHVSSDILTSKDLASNYYASDKDIGRPFLEDVILKLSALNNNVKVEYGYNLNLNHEISRKYDIAVFCDYNLHDLFFWNNYCRNNDIKFIMLHSHGIFGSIFCDFGNNHIVNDNDGEPCATGIIVEIENNELITDEPSHLYSGTVITLKGHIDGFNIMTGENKPIKFLVKMVGKRVALCEYKEIYNDLNQCQLRNEARKSKQLIIPSQIPKNLTFTEIKISMTMKFNSLIEANTKPTFDMFDTINWDIPKILHTFTNVLSMWRSHNKLCNRNVDNRNIWEMYPSSSDYELFNHMLICELRSLFKDVQYTNNIQCIFDKMIYTCRGRIIGIDSVIGAIGAQEVIKGATNKYIPTNQYLYVESLNILPDNYVNLVRNNAINRNITNTRYDGQIAIFGRDYVKKLHDNNIFIVGAGAIGCEHLKNLSLMGIKHIIITDMDNIENSNLNRQFLFGKSDIGKSKSATAAKKTKLMNSDVEITPHEYKMGKDTMKIYDSTFFRNVDIVANALDNVESRLFVDSLCVRYNKPLLESGTMGTKGNIQPIIPNLTDSYGSTQDPPEQNIPLCTLKLFPNKFEHVVQYARDMFEGYFKRIPRNLIECRDNEASLEKMTPTEINNMYEDVKTITYNCKNFKDCINLAYKEWHHLFRDMINQLVRKYPIDHVDECGISFWSGNKIFPQSFNFDNNNELHIDFIISFSHIWADVCGIPHNKRYSPKMINKYKQFINRLRIPKEVLCKDIDNNEIKTKKIFDVKTYCGNVKNLIDTHYNFVTNIKTIDFDKDDNIHIAFISALSNNRAKNYSIPTQDTIEVKGIAGKIIPAISTTTSVVSGLIALEVYKIIYGQQDESYIKIDRYRCGSFNLAVQLFGFSEPVQAKNMVISGIKRNLWSKDILDPNILIGELMDLYSNIDIIFGDNGIIYSKYSDEEYDQDTKLIDILHKYDPTCDEYYITISLGCGENSISDADNMITCKTCKTCKITKNN